MVEEKLEAQVVGVGYICIFRVGSVLYPVIINAETSHESVTHHVFENLPQSDHITSVIIPHLPQCFQQEIFLVILHAWIRCPRRKGWYNFLAGQSLQILDDKGSNAVVKCVSMFIEDHIVCISMIFLEGKVGSVMILYFTDIFR